MSRLKLKRGMALAAGLGIRMRPITDSMPKALVKVGGRTMLDRVLDHFAAAGIGKAVVNTHYFADQVVDHLAPRKKPKIILSHEDDLLETGGGVSQALPYFKGAPFVAANSDALWLDGYTPALARLAQRWEDGAMDALLLLHPTVAAVGYEGRGDYFLDPSGIVRRRRDDQISPFLFAGVQILHPRLFADAPQGKFSLNVLYDRAEEAGRLYGLRHDGLWFHVGTPESIDVVEARLKGLDPSQDWG